MKTNYRLTLGILAALSSGSAMAQVVFDGTLPGTTAGSLGAVAGTYSINQDRGFVNGSNLFHSFQEFNIDAGETAAFHSTDVIRHILSRVTGNVPSTINGTLTASNSNITAFWFINPAGLLIGDSAVIDVPGAIAFGAAGFVEFADGGRWYPLGNGGDEVTALSVNPVDFGFLPGEITGDFVSLSQSFQAGVDRIVGNDGASSWSSLFSGRNVLMGSAGDLILENSKIVAPEVVLFTSSEAGVGIFDSQITAPLTFTVSQGVTLIVDSKLSGSAVLKAGETVILGNSDITTPDGGLVLIQGRRVDLIDSEVRAPNGLVGIAAVETPLTLNVLPVDSPEDFLFESVPPWPTQPTATNPISAVSTVIDTSSDAGSGGIYLLGELIRLSNTSVKGDHRDQSPAGARGLGIHVVGRSLELNNSALQSTVNPLASADGGPIDINLTGDLLLNLSSLDTLTQGAGDAGDININAANLRISGDPERARGFISSGNAALPNQEARARATGNAGNITINLTGDLTSERFAFIDSGTQHIGATTDENGNARGIAGNITISARSLELNGSGFLAAGTNGTARAGDITIKLSGHFRMVSDDSGTPLAIQSGSISEIGFEEPAGEPGDIHISVDSIDPAEGWISISGGSQPVLLSSGTVSGGSGGAIYLDASGFIDIDNSLFATGAFLSVRPDTVGGDITIQSADQVTIRGGSILGAGADSNNVIVENDSIGGNTRIEGASVVIADSDIFTGGTEGRSAGGDVDIISSGRLTLTGANISTFTSAEFGAEGGSVMLSSGASNELLIDRTTVLSVSPTADGGDITVDAGSSPMTIVDSVLIASAGAGGDGGNIVIENVGQMIVHRSQILADAEGGNGGNIRIEVPGGIFVQDSESIVAADSDRGIPGEITIDSPVTDLNSQLQPKDVSVSSPPAPATNTCSPAHSDVRSTFIRAGRGGVTERPDSYLTSITADSGQDAKHAGTDINASALESGITRTASTDTAPFSGLGEGCL